MDKVLKPDRLDLDPNSNVDSKFSSEYKHWKATFANFLTTLTEANSEEKKYQVLINHVRSDIYDKISDQTQYTASLAVLDQLFIKEKNETFARHRLLTRFQKEGETLSQYMYALENLAKDCYKFEAVTASLVTYALKLDIICKFE